MKASKFVSSIFASLIVVLIFYSNAQTAPITFAFKGDVVFMSLDAGIDPSVRIGDSFQGLYTFESMASDVDDFSSDIGDYQYTTLAPSGMTMTANIGKTTLQTNASVEIAPGGIYSRILLGRNGSTAFTGEGVPLDEYTAISSMVLPDGRKGLMFIDMFAPSSLNTIQSDNLPITPPNLALFSQYPYEPTFEFHEYVDNDYSTHSLFAGKLTALNIAVVPEPISSTLFIIGGTLLAGRRYLKSAKEQKYRSNK